MSPIFADQHDLPETIIILNEDDCLYEQGLKYTNLLKSADVTVAAQTFPSGHLGYHFANVDERAHEPINWLVAQLT